MTDIISLMGADFTPPDVIEGTIELYYRDPDFRLNVTSRERHLTFAQPRPYDDGLYDFTAADYEGQREALLRMLACGKTCEMVFRVEGYANGQSHTEQSQSFYFAKISLHEDGSRVSIQPYVNNLPETYLKGLDLSDKALARQVYDLAFGGFVAMEAACMNNIWDYQSHVSEVVSFLHALPDAREKDGLLNNIVRNQKQSLTSQIRSVGARRAPERPGAGERTHDHTNERG